MLMRNNFPGRCCVCSGEVPPQTGYLYKSSDAVIESLRGGSKKWLTLCAGETCYATFHGRRTATGVNQSPALLADGTVIAPETDATLPFLRAMATLEMVEGGSRWRALRNPGDRPHVLAVAEKLGLAIDPSWRECALPDEVERLLARARARGAWPYQLDGIRWLATRASDDTMKGCLLADEPGCGKTIQTLLSLREDEALVVVCPKTAASVWPREIAKWCPERFDAVHVVPDSDSFAWPSSEREAVIVTYERAPWTKAMIANERARLLGDRDGVSPNPTAKKQADKLGREGLQTQLVRVEEALGREGVNERDALEKLREGLLAKLERNERELARNARRKQAKKPPTHVALVLDEVHRAANAKALRTIAVRALTRHASRVVGLTGTPVEDDPFLLSSLLTTCCCNPFDRDLLLWGFHASKQPHGGYEFEHEPSTVAGAKGAIKVRPGIPELLRRIMLRRRKADVLDDLPPKIFTEIPVPIDDAMRARLDAIAADDEVKRLVAEGELPPFHKIAEVRGLLAEMLVPTALALVEEYEAQSTPLVVFAEHKAPIEALRKRKGWPVVTGEATTIGGKRAPLGDLVREFQEGHAPGFAGTIAACGDSITLTRASHMLFVDLAYSHRLNSQAYDRSHRPGQRECVNIVVLVPDHPIARHVAAVLARKSDFATTVLDQSSAVVPTRSPVLPALASELDADASERRALARARVLGLVLSPVDPALAATVEREADARARSGALTRAEVAALAWLLPGAREGRPVALASALALVSSHTN